MNAKFAYLSHDKGKTIKKDDALNLLRALGQNPSNKEFEAALVELKYSSYTNLNQEQFQNLAGHMWRDDDHEEQLKRAFKVFDKNGDGILDMKEFKEIMMKRGEPLNQEEFDALTALVDQDHNGKISYSGSIITYPHYDVRKVTLIRSFSNFNINYFSCITCVLLIINYSS